MLTACEKPEIGIREGEKLHEVMITKEDSITTYEYKKHFIIYPHYEWWNKEVLTGGKLVKPGFEYSSGTNTQWMTVDDLRNALAKL